MIPNLTGYSRLRNIFHSGLNFAGYSEMVNTVKNPVVGNLPSDIIGAIKKVFPENVGLQVQQIKDGFSKSSEILKELDVQMLPIYSKTKIPMKLKERFSEATISGNKEHLEAVQKELFGLFKPPSSILEPLQEKTSQILRSHMSGILPQNAQIRTTYIDAGIFGDGFKIEFLDSHGNKIFRDRVLKVYKAKEMIGKKNAEIKKAITHDCILLPEKKLLKIVQNSKSVEGESVHFDPLDYIVNFKKSLAEEMEALNNHAFNEQAFKVHSTSAEANSTMFVKRVVGHTLDKTNLINPDMFDLRSNYSIAPFSDYTLPKITSEINFSRYGLKHTDISKNPDNTVAGRIVDFGGIVLKNKKLADKTVLKYYKKIMNRENVRERAELIRRYKELAKNPRTPLRNKIQQAIEIAEREISPNNKPKV